MLQGMFLKTLKNDDNNLMIIITLMHDWPKRKKNQSSHNFNLFMQPTRRHFELLYLVIVVVLIKL